MPNLSSVTFQKVLDETRRLTRTDSTRLPDTTSTSGAASTVGLTNQTYLEIQRTLAAHGITVFGVIEKTDFILNQTDFAKPTDSFDIVRIEVNYNNVADNNQWQMMTEADLANLPTEWYDFVQNNIATNPAFFDYGGQFYVAPLNTNATQALGMRFWSIKQNTDVAAGTDQIPYPLNFYWPVIANGNAFHYFDALEGDDSQAEAEKYRARYEGGLDDMVTALGNVNTSPVKSQVPDYFNGGNL